MAYWLAPNDADLNILKKEEEEEKKTTTKHYGIATNTLIIILWEDV